ncbi:protein MMS22-like [Saccoglossus kowalevskii]
MALLECKRDPYLQRRIKDIVCQYFLRFPMRGSASTGSIGASIACSTNHPFLTALQESCTPNASDAARNLRLLMLELLHSNYLVITNNQISPNITTSLVFLKELFRRTTVTEEIARNTFVLFSALLDILLVCDSSAVTAVKKLAVGVLQAMLTAFQQVHDSSSGARVTLQTELQVFISRHFGTSYISVLHVMEAVAVLYRSLVIDVMPKLLDEVYNVERKRGVGTDKARRKAVCKLLHHLGDEGKHFIEIMQEEGDLF